MTAPIIYASLICIVAVIGEGLFMGTKGAKFLRDLKQPRYSPPTWAWSLVGVAYYGICFFVLVRLIGGVPSRKVSLLLLIVLMAANTFWNFVFFRLQDLRAAFWYSIAYCALAVLLFITLLKGDEAALLAFGVYMAYLPYAAWNSYCTWKLNIQQ